MVCVATDYINGNAIFWQSKYPAWTLRYGLVYIYIMVIHDNTANAYVGMEIPQGTQLFSEGTAGNANGNHNHIEVGIGQYPGYMYVKSGYLTEWGTTVYMMPGNVDPSDVFFVDDTQITNCLCTIQSRVIYARRDFKTIYFTYDSLGKNQSELKEQYPDLSVDFVAISYEPTFEPLSEEVQAQYKALKSYYPNTVIQTGCFTKIKYVADTKLYIDKKVLDAIQEVI